MDSNYLAKQNIYLSEYIEDVFDLHLHSKIVYDLKKILLCARALARGQKVRHHVYDLQSGEIIL